MPLLAFLDVGGPEMLVIFVLILVLFGGKRMPELARGLGKSIREFKRATAGVEDQLKRALEEEPVRAKPAKTLPAAAALATTTPEDTSVYDEASGSTTASDVDAPPDPVADEASASISDNAADANTASATKADYEDVDPYEDEYIGGTASSDARAHGIENDAPESTGASADANDIDATASDPKKSETGETEPKKNATGDAASANDGGGI